MKKRLISGNEAIVEGALAANLEFFSAYPITPISAIIHQIAESNVKFIQAEDEIAAINMCIGASLAGNKTITATSGPGFSLKQEAIGAAFKMEVPLVIINSQRVGPSTGIPTLASQGDLLQAKHGSHGDYVNIVFYPNSVEECYKYIIESINAAEESLSPIILLMDSILSSMYETVNLEKIKFTHKKRELSPLGTKQRNFTGLCSDNGIGTKDSKIYKKWYENRKKEILDVAKKYNFYEYIENKEAETLLIAYGICSRAILSLKDNYSIFRPIRMFPIVEELKEIAKKYKKIVIIEMNDGQYKGELESFLKKEIKLISQLGGKISLEEIKNELSKIH